MGNKYGNPPVIEAVCEFRFTEGTEWDLIVPGAVYDELRADFPGKEERRNQVIDLVSDEDGLRQRVRVEERMVLSSSDGKTLVQVGQRLMAVNRLQPYEAWEEFSPQIAKAFEALQRRVHLNGIERIGLRYINRIEIPQQVVDLDEYFGFRPFLCNSLPQNLESFMIGCQVSVDRAAMVCRLQLTNAIVEPGKAGFILDIDCFSPQPNAVDPSEAMLWISDAHEKAEEIFEGCISDKLRALFGKVS